MPQRRLTVPAEHPALPGHFPGDPVVPGVVLLDLVLESVARWWPQARIGEVLQAKFLCPVRPEQPLEVAVEPGMPGQLKFRCSVDGQSAASGVLRLREVR